MEELNEIILKYVTKFQISDFSDFASIDKMSKIILNSKVPNFRDKIKNRYGLSKSFQLSYDFFNFLDKSYGDYFYCRVFSDALILKYYKKNTETAFSFADEFGEKRIYLPYSNDICDCFTLTHEMFHDMNLDVNNLSVTRSHFTEYISMYGEMLLEDFINDNYDIKCACNTRYTFNSCYIKALNVNFKVNLIKCFLDNGYINTFNLNQIIHSYNSYYKRYLCELVNDIIRTSNIDILYINRYLVGILLSCYSKDLFSDKKYDIDTFLCLNEDINEMYPEEFYSVLDLDVNDNYSLELTPDSYNKLRKSYCKHMR